MATPLGGQIALVTGGGRGIGRTLALGLARAGADVVVVARTKVEVDAVAEAIRELGRRALAVTANIESRAGAQRAVDECAQHLGPPGVLVNAAAVQGPIGRFDTLDLDAWAYTVRVDLLGMAFVTHAVLQHMVAMRRGKIVNLSGGGSASPRPRFSAYTSSKAAVVRLTETLAEELLEANVQVNAVDPGATWTRMTEEVLEAGATAGPKALTEALKVWETGGTPPERQVELVIFLASSASDLVTGRLIHVNDPWRELFDGSALPGDLFRLRRVGPSLVKGR